MTKYWLFGGVLALSACGGGRGPTPDVPVQGADYAFVGVPETLAAGPTTFSYQNIGKVRHEMGIEQLVAGRTFQDVLEADAKKTPDDSLYAGTGGILITKPGETAPGRILVDLIPGRTYLIWCDFRDSTGAKRHSEMGMLAAFTVR